MTTPRFDAYTYPGTRHVVLADGTAGPISPLPSHEARALGHKLIAAADAAEGITSAPLLPSERRRLASQALAVADSGCDASTLRSGLRFLASETLAGISAVADDGFDCPVVDRRQGVFHVVGGGAA